jgi:hypothetical protein
MGHAVVSLCGLVTRPGSGRNAARSGRADARSWQAEPGHRIAGPVVERIAPIHERYEHTRVEKGLHRRRRFRPKAARYRLLVERSRGPSTIPTYFASASSAVPRRALRRAASAWRTMCPSIDWCGAPRPRGSRGPRPGDESSTSPPWETCPRYDVPPVSGSAGASSRCRTTATKRSAAAIARSA